MSDEKEASTFDGSKYVLTAVTHRASWRERVGDEMVTRTKRFRRGDRLEGLSEAAVDRLIKGGHAVSEADYDPQAIQQEKALKRLRYDQSAAANVEMELELRRRQAAAGQQVVGLADAPVVEEHEVDGIKVEDIDTMPEPKEGEGDGGDAADLTSTTPASEDYSEMTYPQLQNLAKTRTGNGGGSREELIERLQQHDAQ